MSETKNVTIWASIWAFITKSTVTKTISIVICVAVLFFAGFGTGHAVAKHKYQTPVVETEFENSDESQKEDTESAQTVTTVGYLDDLAKIKPYELKTLKSKALQEIQNNQKEYNGQCNIEYSDYKYEGAYLFNSKNNDSNILYIVYSFTATQEGNHLKDYTWAKTENVELMSDGSITTSGDWRCSMNFAGFSDLYTDIVFGDSSLKELYHDKISDNIGKYTMKTYGNVYKD